MQERLGSMAQGFGLDLSNLTPSEGSGEDE
jgi:hypothetical protein